MEYTITDVPLSEALEDVAPMIEPQIAARNLTYHVRNAKRLPVGEDSREFWP